MFNILVRFVDQVIHTNFVAFCDAFESSMNDLFIDHFPLTHWSRVTHICINELTIIGSDNGLSPGRRRRQAIIWTNDGILLIGTWGAKKNRAILIKLHTFSFTKMRLKMSSRKRRPFCFNFNVLKCYTPFIPQSILSGCCPCGLGHRNTSSSTGHRYVYLSSGNNVS